MKESDDDEETEICHLRQKPGKKMGQTDGLDPKREKLSILFRKT